MPETVNISPPRADAIELPSSEFAVITVPAERFGSSFEPLPINCGMKDATAMPITAQAASAL